MLILQRHAPEDEIVIGDLVLFEILQGARDDLHASALELGLSKFQRRSMMGEAVLKRAASIYRQLRGEGITIRKTVDLLIATYCIVHDHDLLQRDRDFAPIAKRFGLRIL